MERQHEKRKWTKRGRRELSPSIERRGRRRRESARAKDSSSPSIEKRGHRRRASPRAKEPLASEKRRELSRSRSRQPKGRPARSSKKETTKERVRGLSSRQRKEEASARADSHVLARFSNVGKIIVDMLLQKVSRDECIDICYYVVDGPAAEASLTCGTCSKRFTSQAFLEKHMQSKHPTEARGISARAVPRKRPRKQPVQDETSSSSARAVPHTRPRTQQGQDGTSPYYYSSSESEADHGETCEKAETVRKAESEADHGETCESAKAKATVIRPMRPRELWRQVKQRTLTLTEPRSPPR
jgi:hypothetical protein